MLIVPTHRARARRWRLLGFAAACAACSASDRTRTTLSVALGDPEGPVFYAPAMTNGSAPPRGDSSSLDGLVVEQEPLPAQPINIATSCVFGEAKAELVKQPVDIIVLLDNSGSMIDEAAAVEANINVNFASVLAQSAVDYRMILLTRHRTEPRTTPVPDGEDDPNEEANTSVCVQAPLSGLTSCDRAAEPVFTERFKQYSTKLESHDSFDIAIDTYELPFDDDEREEKYDHAPLGWSEWLRTDTKKVFLEITDDDERSADDDDEEDVEDMSAADFAGALVRMAPQHFGTDPARPNFVFHSIVGLAEKDPVTAAYLPEEPVQGSKCTGNAGDVTSAGETYQELSRLTGGLRFPLCQFDAYDVVFQRIAEDVVLQRDIACDFDVPDPPRGRELKLDNVAIETASGTGGVTAQLGQARTVDECQPDAFYVVDGRLNLCPQACAQVRSDPLAAVRVLFTCQSQIIVPR
ncbi:MAG: hypothetical protein RL685_2118 [Pseudomonadota bacterium]